MSALEKARYFQNKPVAWIQAILRASLWQKQQEIARSVVRHRITAVRSCRGSGKTHLLARLVLWWLFTRPYSIVVTTAPTDRQVKDLLWKEIRMAYAEVRQRGKDLGGELLPQAPVLRIADGWAAFGFSSNDPVNYQGHHSAAGVLIVLDEATGVADPIWAALRGSLANPASRMIAIGNPREPTGAFYDLFAKGGEDVGKHHISAFDVPNVVNGEQTIPGLMSRELVEEIRQQYGEDSSVWVNDIMGDFSDGLENVIAPLSWVERAMAYRPSSWSSPVIHAADIARAGADSTVTGLFHPEGMSRLTRHPKMDLMACAGMIIAECDEAGAVASHIDATGMGGGPFDRVREIRPSLPVEMIYGARASDPNRYANRRAEWYWHLRTLLDPSNEQPYALVDDDNLKAQLTSIRWKHTSRGQIQIEPKDEIKKRLRRSPDEADVAMMGAAVVDTGPKPLLSASLDLGFGVKTPTFRGR